MSKPMNKPLSGALCAGLIAMGLATTAQASLISRLGGTAVYDTVLDITWLADANAGAGSVYDNGIFSTDGSMSWPNAVAWADGLVFGGFSDWRLASMDVNGDNIVVDCLSASEVDCRDNEYGYMFYQNGVSQGSPSPFSNVMALHWSGTEFVPLPGDPLLPDYAWLFQFQVGGNGLYFGGESESATNHAWAVRSGDVAASAPEPTTLLLLGVGLAGIGMVRCGKRRLC